jgi:hypothetical protein
MDVPGTSVSSNNTSQKVFIGNDKISELVNDSDSNGGNFSEHSDNDTCETNSLFSSSSSISSSSSTSSDEVEVIQPEPGRGRKRTRRTLPKRKDTDFALGWKERILMVQKPAFYGVPGINKKFNITQDSSP